MSDHHNVLSASVVALVAVAGLVLYYANSATGNTHVAIPGIITETGDSFALGLEAGKECMNQDSKTMHNDQWRMCCEDKCNTQNKCKNQEYVHGLRIVNECSRNCNSGCREQIRRDTLLLSKSYQKGTGVQRAA
ncbi:MAG: hypothetical protein AABX52_03970 [Nanoarchaeota archaeon]